MDNPLCGLIQDHVDSGVKLFSLDTFLERHEYQQLLFDHFYQYVHIMMTWYNKTISIIVAKLLSIN